VQGSDLNWFITHLTFSCSCHLYFSGMWRAEIDELTAIPGGPIGPISPRSPCQINAVVDYIEGINICSLCSWKQMSGVKKNQMVIAKYTWEGGQVLWPADYTLCNL